MLRHSLAVLAAALCAAPPPATAGIINVQSVLTTEAEEGLSGALTGSLDWRTGNISSLSLGATPVARYRDGDHVVIAILRAEYRTSEDLTLASRLFEHLRYRYRLTDRLTGEVFGQHEYDGVRRLQFRALAGAGPKVELVGGDGYSLALGAAYMIEYERLANDDEIDAGFRDVQHRASSYIVGHYQIDDRLQVASTVYAQPRLTDLGDYRILSESQITVKVTQRLSMTTALSIAYDRAPPATIDPFDSALQSALTYEF